MKKSTKTPFMPAEAYGGSLTGFNVNLVVREVAPVLRFLREVLVLFFMASPPRPGGSLRPSPRLYAWWESRGSSADSPPRIVLGTCRSAGL